MRKERDTGLRLNLTCKYRTEVSRSGQYAKDVHKETKWSTLSQKTSRCNKKKKKLVCAASVGHHSSTEEEGWCEQSQIDTELGTKSSFYLEGRL